MGSYEREKRKPSAELLEALFTHLQLNPKWLFSGEGEMFSSEEHKEDEGLLKVSIDYENAGSCGQGSFINEECPDTIYISKFWVKNILRASNKD